ncbi:hypothetical protein KO361_01825 [Candidatus Woesearchaeota archaeon]|nr:hypothetical protein [Candidatus Woesearchaeota archaeon]
MDEEYELLSHEEVERLKKEAEKYKDNPFVKGNSEDKLYSAIIDLNKSIHKLTSVFEDVKQQILLEQETGEGPDSKIEKILDQNRQIARALVSFGEKMENISISQQAPQQTFNQPTNFNQQPQTNTEPTQQRNNIELDYQSLNYNNPNLNNNPNEPKPTNNENNQPTNFNQQSQNQQQNNFSQGLQENQQNLQFPKPNDDAQQSMNQQQNNNMPFPNQNMPNLKQIQKDKPPEKKKRTFGLF